MASFDASFILMCCTAASAPPGFAPLQMRMSPMWLTSKTPTPPRTALCSAISPPLDGYSTGISHPPKLTILAPRRRCNAFSGVLRSSLLWGVAADSIPMARVEIDTSMRSPVGSKKPAARGARQQGGAFEKRRDFLFGLQYYILQEDRAWM